VSKELWLLSFSLAIYAVFIVGELVLSSIKRKQTYHIKDTATSIWFAVLGGSFDVLMRGSCFLVLDFFNQHAIYSANLLNLYPIWAWVVVFIAQDFFFYWLHRSEHSIRLLWAVHSNHHSSEYFNFTVALRSSIFQPFYRFWFYIPIALLGFDGLTIMFVYAINQIYQFFLHTEFGGQFNQWGKVFVTPSHHRVHHANNDIYLDKNMGQVLIIWDKLFGTFQAELKAVPCQYGLTTNINTYHPIKSVLKEFARLSEDIKSTKSFKEKVNYLIQTPNWKPKKYDSHISNAKTITSLADVIK
jgi:sterol desaturase/sphingolipid hydroxylase (fatty acid hydroxylase superfamily)